MANTRKRRKHGITRRWITASLLVMITVLAVAATVLVVSTRQSNYSAAQMLLESRIRLEVRSIPSAATPSTMRDIVEGFSEKERFELMLVNNRGTVSTTSSGFVYNTAEPLDDFYQAATDPDGRGAYIGHTTGGEHIIAVSYMLPRAVGDIEAVRMVSSLEGIDEQMTALTQIVITVCLVIVGFSVLSGVYFIRSIVRPLGKIGETASRIADGDFDVRVENVYNDEIGELCDVINDMAVGLSVYDRLKNEFITSVSHELRTPLTAIKGWGETLQTTAKDNPAVFDKGMDIIISETARLSVLVEDMLDFSRLQAGGPMKVNRIPIDLGPVIRGTVEIFEQRARNLGIAIELKKWNDPILIQGDQNRLRQVFTNIIDNAIKYSKSSGSIMIDIARQAKRVVVTVADNGIGIPKTELGKVTDRFFKASNSLTGSGIGLAVVKEIIVLHEGSIKFDSVLGKGTTVTITLPLAEQ
jgi:signal transduction histidine kinase